MPGQPALDTPSIALGIDATELQVIDAGLKSERIIRTTESFELQTCFELGGMLADWLVSLGLPYKVTYYAESFAGNDYEDVIATTEGKTVAGQLKYCVETKATVPAGTLPAGLYKPTVVVSFSGAPPVPITAFYEGEVFQVF